MIEMSSSSDVATACLVASSLDPDELASGAGSLRELEIDLQKCSILSSHSVYYPIEQRRSVEVTPHLNPYERPVGIFTTARC